MRNIERRIRRIEERLAIGDKTQWLRIPDPDNPGQMVEIRGFRTLAEWLLYWSRREGKE